MTNYGSEALELPRVDVLSRLSREREGTIIGVTFKGDDSSENETFTAYGKLERFSDGLDCVTLYNGTRRSLGIEVASDLVSDSSIRIPVDRVVEYDVLKTVSKGTLLRCIQDLTGS